MSDWREFTGKTVDDALTNALVELETTSDKVEYEVLEEGSSGILGLFSKAAVIRVKKLDDIRETAVEFLNDVFKAMEMDVDIEIEYNEVENQMNIELSGDEMGMLIGKRGVTLDSLQYLVSLVINKKTEEYVKVKIDTENYRQRRKETLENLARNLAHKVKRIHKSVILEPMNPYERRVIHSTLQNDKYAENSRIEENHMEKAKFTFSDGSGADEFFVLEETKINGFAYILVVDSEEDDAECLILREVEESKDAEKTYEIVEDDTELMAVSKVFEELLEDVDIEM